MRFIKNVQLVTQSNGVQNISMDTSRSLIDINWNIQQKNWILFCQFDNAASSMGETNMLYGFFCSISTQIEFWHQLLLCRYSRIMCRPSLLKILICEYQASLVCLKQYETLPLPLHLLLATIAYSFRYLLTAKQLMITFRSSSIPISPNTPRASSFKLNSFYTQHT